MKHIQSIIRIFTGLFMLVTAASKFGILPTAAYSPELFTPKGWVFISAIVETGYLFPTIGIISLFCGLALLSNRYVALAAALYLPITFNFLIFHLFTDTSFITFRGTPAYLFFILNLYILYSERRSYTSLLKS